MIIVIDIGNTTITIGLSSDGETVQKVVRLNTEKNKSMDEYSVYLNQFITSVDEVIISSVVPEINEVFQTYFEEHFNVTPKFVGSGIKTGIKIITDNPREVGGDIITNVVAATALHNDTCLVVDLGTATTFTYVEKCALKGVVIAPGLTTSRNALITKTSLLPQVELTSPTKILGTNSSDSIKSGLVYGHASMIDGMITRIKADVSKPDLTVVLTGGHSNIIAPLLNEKVILEPKLILKGLLKVYHKNNFIKRA